MLRSLFLLLCLSFAGVKTLHAQQQQAGAAAPDSAELDYVATMLLREDVAVALLEIPTETSPLKTTRQGLLPEADEAFMQLSVEKSIYEFFLVRPLQGDLDSVVFLKAAPLNMEGDEQPVFFPFPGVTWLMFLEKGLQKKDGSLQPYFWLKDLPNWKNLPLITEATAFYLPDVTRGVFSYRWNKEFPMPATVRTIDDAFVGDVQQMLAYLKNRPAGEAGKAYVKNIGTISGKMKSDLGKKLLAAAGRK